MLAGLSSFVDGIVVVRAVVATAEMLSFEYVKVRGEETGASSRGEEEEVREG